MQARLCVYTLLIYIKGRIMSRLSKDQDTIDTELGLIANQVLATARLVIVLMPVAEYSCVHCSSVIGTAGLVFYTFPYLGIIFAPLIVLYYLAAVYYRRTSVEAKRLDSNLRSVLYASYSGKPLAAVQTSVTVLIVLKKRSLGSALFAHIAPRIVSCATPSRAKTSRTEHTT